jgi:hypothetical protein
MLTNAVAGVLAVPLAGSVRDRPEPLPVLFFKEQTLIGGKSMENNLKKDDWLTRNWKWFVPVIVVAAILICCGFMTVFATTISTAMKSSGAYQQAVSITQESPAAKEVLGSPIKPKFWMSGSISENGASGNADLAIPVSGSHGSGTVFVVATKSGGLWDFETLVLVLDDSGERIDLLVE